MCIHVSAPNSFLVCIIKSETTIHFRLPWNQDTALGWFAEVTFALSATVTYIIVNGCFTTFFTGICMHQRAYYQIFQTLSTQFTNERNTKNLLVDLIHYHNTSKSVFVESSKTFNGIILIVLVCGTGFFSCTIFQLDLVQLNKIMCRWILINQI